MIDPLQSIYAKAKQTKRHIVLAEGMDPRIIDGAADAINQNLASITLLGPKDQVADKITERGFDASKFN
ncbi:MAG: phosphate acyltransferase, partial [Pseudomonadota bacterium]